MVDLSALEDRIIANLSKDENKCSIFLDGVDGHCMNSYIYFKEEVEAILPRESNESTVDYLKKYHKAIEEGNKQLKAIRQKSKPITFALSYGAYPPKIASAARISLEEAEKVFHRYHTELYPKVSEMRDKVLKVAKKNKKVHLGLGCYLNSSKPEEEIRTLFNANCQFWSIITLLTINKFRSMIQENNLSDKIEIVSTIYDSIYLHIVKDSKIIKWVNDTIIPILTTPIFVDTIVNNEAEGELGYNWYDTIPIRNNAELSEIEEALETLDKNRK